MHLLICSWRWGQWWWALISGFQTRSYTIISLQTGSCSIFQYLNRYITTWNIHISNMILIVSYCLLILWECWAINSLIEGLSIMLNIVIKTNITWANCGAEVNISRICSGWLAIKCVNSHNNSACSLSDMPPNSVKSCWESTVVNWEREEEGRMLRSSAAFAAICCWTAKLSDDVTRILTPRKKEWSRDSIHAVALCTSRNSQTAKVDL